MTSQPLYSVQRAQYGTLRLPQIHAHGRLLPLYNQVCPCRTFWLSWERHLLSLSDHVAMRWLLPIDMGRCDPVGWREADSVRSCRTARCLQTAGILDTNILWLPSCSGWGSNRKSEIRPVFIWWCNVGYDAIICAEKEWEGIVTTSAYCCACSVAAYLFREKKVLTSLQVSSDFTLVKAGLGDLQQVCLLTSW